MTTLQLKKFDIKKIKNGSAVLIIGKRNKGDNSLIKDILYHNRDIPTGTIISGIEKSRKEYSKIVPQKSIHDKYSPELISNVKDRQMEVAIRKINENKNDPRAFLILDNCFDNDEDDTKKWPTDKNITTCFLNSGSHRFKLLCIMATSNTLKIRPHFRMSIDYLFISKENDISKQKLLYERYIGIFPSFNIFISTIDQYTKNNEYLVVDKTSISNKIEDQVFWYKAESHDNFKIGDKTFCKI